MAGQRVDEIEQTVPPADGEAVPPGTGAVDVPHSAEVDDAAGGPTVPSAEEEVATKLGDFA